MKRFVSVTLTVACALSVSCRTTSKSGLKDATLGPPLPDVEMIKCDKGDLAFFNVVPNKDLSEKDFTIFDGSVPTTVQTTLRLDVCTEGDELTIKRVVGTSEESMTAIITDISDKAIVKGLKEAIFEDDYSKLEVRIPLDNWVSWQKKPTTDILYMQGSSKGGLIATIAQPSGDTFKQGTDYYLNFSAIGKLEYAEPKEITCLEVPGVETRTETYDTVKLTLVGKASGFGTSNGPEWKACHITLVDTNPKAKADANKKIVVLSDAKDLDPRVSVTGGSGHHGTCAWRLIETPWATYATRGMKVAEGNDPDCAFEKAPEPVPSQPNSFKIIYKSDVAPKKNSTTKSK